MTYTPNLTVGRDWRGTLNKSFSILRRVLFLTPDDYEMVDFDPQFDGNGMTVSAFSVPRCRKMLIGKMLWISLDIRATLAAPFATSIKITIPNTATGTAAQQGATSMANAGVAETGHYAIDGGKNVISFLRGAFGAYTAGAAQWNLNAFIEVEN